MVSKAKERLNRKFSYTKQKQKQKQNSCEMNDKVVYQRNTDVSS